MKRPRVTRSCQRSPTPEATAARARGAARGGARPRRRARAPTVSRPASRRPRSSVALTRSCRPRALRRMRCRVSRCSAVKDPSRLDQDVRVTGDHVERRAQLVRHGRDELGLEPAWRSGGRRSGARSRARSRSHARSDGEPALLGRERAGALAVAVHLGPDRLVAACDRRIHRRRDLEGRRNSSGTTDCAAASGSSSSSPGRTPGKSGDSSCATWARSSGRARRSRPAVRPASLVPHHGGAPLGSEDLHRRGVHPLEQVGLPDRARSRRAQRSTSAARDLRSSSACRCDAVSSSSARFRRITAPSCAATPAKSAIRRSSSWRGSSTKNFEDGDRVGASEDRNREAGLDAGRARPAARGNSSSRVTSAAHAGRLVSHARPGRPSPGGRQTLHSAPRNRPRSAPVAAPRRATLESVPSGAGIQAWPKTQPAASPTRLSTTRSAPSRSCAPLTSSGDGLQGGAARPRLACARAASARTPTPCRSKRGGPTETAADVYPRPRASRARGGPR